MRAAYQHVRVLERKLGLASVEHVAADTPILAAEALESYLEVDRILGDGSALFVLRGKGDSMGDRQIYQGDSVIVRTQPSVGPGEVGVVVIAEEVTVNTVLHRRSGRWLPAGHAGVEPAEAPCPDPGLLPLVLAPPDRMWTGPSVGLAENSPRAP